MPSVSFSLGLHDSQPQHKRRKIEFKLTEVLSASPSLRKEGLKLIHRDSVSENLDGAEDILKAVFESQHLSLSHEDAARSDASKSSVEELQQNGEGHIIEGSEASTRLQVEEVLVFLSYIPKLFRLIYVTSTIPGKVYWVRTFFDLLFDSHFNLKKNTRLGWSLTIHPKKLQVKAI